MQIEEKNNNPREADKSLSPESIDKNVGKLETNKNEWQARLDEETKNLLEERHKTTIKFNIDFLADKIILASSMSLFEVKLTA